MDLMTEPVGLKLKGERTGTDPHGNPIYGPDTVDAWLGWIEPRGSSEGDDDRQIYGYWVDLPLNAPLEGADAVVLFGTEQDGQIVGGTEFQVVGEPGRQPGGLIVPGFIRAAVKKVTG